jgi:hypothetical protein
MDFPQGPLQLGSAHASATLRSGAAARLAPTAAALPRAVLSAEEVEAVPAQPDIPEALGRRNGAMLEVHCYHTPEHGTATCVNPAAQLTCCRSTQR